MNFERYNKDSKNMMVYLIALFVIGTVLVSFYKPLGYTDPDNYNGAITPSLVYNFIIAITAFVLQTALWLIRIFSKKTHSLSWKKLAVSILCENIIIGTLTTAMALNFMNSIIPLGLGITRLFTLILFSTTTAWTVSILAFMVRDKNRVIEEMKAQQQTADVKPQPLSPDILPSRDTCMFYNLNGKFAFSVKRECVLFMESNDNYVKVHYLNDGKPEHSLIHNSLKNLETNFAPYGFIRCHRGYMVNINKVKTLRRQRDILMLELHDTPTLIPVTKTYAEKILNLFAPAEGKSITNSPSAE